MSRSAVGRTAAFHFWPLFLVDRSNWFIGAMTLIPFAVRKADGIIAESLRLLWLKLTVTAYMNIKSGRHILVCLLFALSGCSSDRNRPTQDNLQPTRVSNQIVVEEELVINTFKGGSNGLVPGVYVPIAESPEGVFYDGPKDCVWELMNAERKTYEGGVWWPKSLNAKPRIYWRLSEKQLPEKRYDGTTIGGPIVYWIIQSGLGKANFFPEISDERIRKVISPREPVSKVGKH